MLSLVAVVAAVVMVVVVAADWLYAVFVAPRHRHRRRR